MLLNKHFSNWVISLSLLFIPIVIANFMPARNESLNVKKITVETDTIKPVVGNQGNSFITNYNCLSKQVWSMCQDNNGLMLFANKLGVCVFDGNKHEYIKLPTLPIKIINLPEHEIVLVGGDNQYGYLQTNNIGKYEYKILSFANTQYGEISNVQLSKTHIYFFSNKSLSIYNRATLEQETEIIAKEKEEYSGMFLLNNQLYLIIKDNGLYKVVTKGKLEHVKGSKAFSKHSLMFSFPFSDKSVLLGISSNQVYEFNGIQLDKFTSKVENYIEENQLVDGISLDEDKFVLGTLSNGIFVVDKKSDKITDIINYQNGLPDDEILAMFADKQGNIWLSHGFGISKINYTLPIKDYNFYPGIEGKLIDMLQFDNTIYVATTEGVFYLDEIQSIQELSTYIKKIKKPKEKGFFEKVADIFSSKKKTDTETKIEPKTEPKTETKNEEKPTKKNFFQRWKQRREEKKKKNDSQTKPIEKEEVPKSQTDKKDTKKTPKKKNTSKKSSNSRNSKEVYTRHSKKILALSYVYKKVANIETKCNQIVKYGGLILVATNDGLYEIKDKKANALLKKVYVNTILSSKHKGLFYIGTNNGMIPLKYEGGKWKRLKQMESEGLEDSRILSIAEDSSGDVWLGSRVSAYRLKIGENYKAESFSVIDLDEKNIDEFELRCIDNDMFFLCRDSIYIFDSATENIEMSDLLGEKCKQDYHISSQEGITWFHCDKSWKVIGENKLESQQFELIKLFKPISNLKIDNENNIWLISGSNQLYKILKSNLPIDSISQFKVYIKSIQTDLKDSVDMENIEIDKNVSSITFNVSAPYFINKEDVEYQYIVKPLMMNWSDWKQSSNIDFIPHSGSYTVQVRARNVFGTVSTSKEYQMRVYAPIWEQFWFILLCTMVFGALIFLLLYIVHRRREEKLREHNKELEEVVERRTLEIQQKTNQLERKNKETTNSINYASKIQSAIFPPLRTLKRVLSDSFVLNKPRDIVSGDFYWLYRESESIIVAVGDCTGHGVPGAFLSILGITYLNEIAIKLDILNPDVILNLLRNKITKTLNQRGYDTKRLDGLDIALVVFNIETKELQFAGANNPVYIVRDGVLTEIKADKMPIGMDFSSEKPFTNHTVSVEEGDSVYLFSDGYIDQFGGKNDKKFLSKNFKELIKVVSKYPMQEQKNILDNTLKEWRDERPQLDDVMVLGFKI